MDDRPYSKVSDMRKQNLESQIILGIDPGTRITGYGILKICQGHLEAIDFGCIRPPVNLELHARYLILFNGLEELMERFSPHAIAIETQFVGKNPQSARKLGMACATAIIAAGRRNIPVIEYAPTRVKQAVTGTGSASKEQVQKMIQLILNLPVLPEPEDAADALALSICHANTLRR